MATQFGASDRGWVLAAGDLFRVLAVRKSLLHYLLALDGLQVLKLVAKHDESSHLYRQKKAGPELTIKPAPLRDRRARAVSGRFSDTQWTPNP